MPYLLDTNTVSYIAKGASHRLLARLAPIEQRETCTSVLVEAELLFGIERRAPAPRLERTVRLVLSGLEILPWTSAAARAYASLRTSVERSGRTLAQLDLLIAAHAIAERCTLVTNDAALLRLSDHLPVETWA